MYTIVSAIGVPFGLNKRWQVIDLTAYTVARLYSTFRKIQITLLPAGSSTQVYLDLYAIVATYGNYNQLFSTLLTSIGNAALPTTSTGVILNKRSAVYKDAFKAGYTVTPVSADNVASLYIPNDQMPNIRLTRTDTSIDYNYFQANCLVNVNGYYHTTTTDGINGVMVKDAMTSLTRSGQNQIAIWNFGPVCPINTIAITPAMVSTTAPGSATAPLINLGIDLTGKNAFMILGGYMVPVDGDVLTQVANSTFQLNFNAIDLVNRYYESVQYINIDSVLAGTTPKNPNQIAISDLTTPTAIAAWLALSQTFFVILNTPEIYMQQLAIKKIGVPNQYISYQKPSSPMVLTLGRQPPYWSISEAGQYLLSIYDNTIGNLLYYTATPGATTTAANQPGTPGNLQNAYLLEVGSDIS